MIAGSLEIQLIASMQKFADDMRKAKDTSSQTMSAIEAQMADVTKALAAMKAEEQSRAGIFSRTFTETKRLLGVTTNAAKETATALANLKIDPDAMKVPKSAFDSLTSWQDKAAYALGSGVAIGAEKAKSAWESFKDWSERQIVIWGTAAALGISAALIGAVYTAFKGVSFAIGLLTGSSYESKNIDALVAMNKEVKQLQENLPLTATGASALNEALKAQGITASTYVETLDKVQTAAHNNGTELDRLGVKYKDANGNFLSTDQILKNAAVVLAGYREGWDRAQAAQAIGMGTEKQMQNALSVTAEKTQAAKDRLVAYGLVIGDGTQQQVTRYEDAMRAFQRESDLTGQGFKRAIADNIMPILTDLAEFFRDGFPTVVMAFRYSLATVMSLLLGLKTSVYAVSEAILGGFSAIGSVLIGLANAAFKAMQGDFSGAKDAFVAGWDEARGRIAQIGSNIVAQAQHNSAEMAQAWGADSLTAQQTADVAAKTGKAWVAASKDQQTSTEDADAGYRRLLKTLKEKLYSDTQLTEVQRLQLDLDALSVKQRAAITAQREQELRQLASEIDAKKALLALNASNEAFAEANDASKKSSAGVIGSYNDELDQQIKNIGFETEQLKAQSGIAAAGLLNKQDELRVLSEINTAQQIASALRQIDIDTATKVAAAEQLVGAEREKTIEQIYKMADAQKAALPDAIKAREAAKLSNDLAQSSVAEFKNLFSTIEQTGHDVFVHVFSDGKSAFESIGKAIKASVIDLLYQLTARKWIISMQASVAGAFGVSGAASAAGTAAGAASGVGTLANLGSMAGSFFNGGFTSTVASGFQNVGSFFGSQGIADIGNELAAGSGALGTVGTMLPYIGAALAAYSIGKAIFGGNGGSPSYALPDSSGSVARQTARYAGLLSQFGGSGSVDFTYYANTGRNSANPNFGVGAYQNGRQLFQVGEDYAGGLQQLTPENLALQESRAMIAALQSSQLPGYLKSFFDSLTPASMSQTDIDNAFAFANSLKSIKDQLAAMGMAAASTSDGLITLLGSLSNSQDLLNQYYQDFFTDGERAANTWKQIDDTLAQMGVTTLPTTRAGFRALVESQDLTTAAGQRTFAALMQLAPAFASVTDAIDATSTAASALADQLKSAIDAANSAIDAQIQASQSAANAAKQTAAAYRSLAQTLDNEVGKIMNTSTAASSARLQSIFQTAMTGDQTALGALPQAAEDFLTAQKAASTSSVDFARAQAQVVEMLRKAELVSTAAANQQDYQAALLQTQVGVLQQIKDELAKPSPDAGILHDQLGMLGTIAQLLNEQTTQIVTGYGYQAAVTVDQTGKVVSATFDNSKLLDKQTGQIITGNATQDVIKNISALDSHYSEEMLKALVTGATTQADSLQGILSANTTTVGLLGQVLGVLQQSEAAAEAAAQAAAAAQAEQARQQQVAQATAAYNAQKAVSDAALGALTDYMTSSGLNPQLVRQEDVAGAASASYQFSYVNQQQLDTVRALDQAYGSAFLKAVDLYRAIPGHATGGPATGWSWVGEHGPELAYFGDRAHIYTAEQSRAMLGGSANEVLADEVAGLRADNADMRSQLASIAKSTASTDKTLKASAYGQQPLITQAAA